MVQPPSALQKINPKVKIVAVSGLASSDKVKAAMSSGAKVVVQATQRRNY